MSAEQYQKEIARVTERIWSTQLDNIRKAAAMMAESVAKGGLVHLFGSGHSVLPVQDVFPRYGSYPVFHPLMDARLMWQNVIGSGGGWSSSTLQTVQVLPEPTSACLLLGASAALFLRRGRRSKRS